jgi:hypothetical protein
MSDTDLPPLDEDVSDLLLRAAKARANIPAGAQGRVLAGVEAALGPGPGPGGGSHGASTPPVSANAWRLWPIAAAFVVGGVTGALVMRALASVPFVPERIVYVDRPAPSSPAVLPAVEAPVEPPPAPPPTTRATAPSSAIAASTPDGDLAAERQLLDVARHAIEQQDGAAALDAVTRHERRFPNGVLVQEREAMAIRALLLLGRGDDARSRADRFRQRFPDSLLLPAVDAAVRR